MSMKATTAAYAADLPGEPLAKLILIALADYAFDDDVAFIDDEELARFCGVSVAAIGEALSTLFKAGHLVPMAANDQDEAPAQPWRVRIGGGD